MKFNLYTKKEIRLLLTIMSFVLVLSMGSISALNWVQPKPVTITSNGTDTTNLILSVNESLSNQISYLQNTTIKTGDVIPMNVINKTTGTSWVGMTLDSILDWIYSWFQATDSKINNINSTLYNYMGYINGTLANITINVRYETASITTIGGNGNVITSNIIGYDLKRIQVVPNNSNTKYRFKATEQTSGDVIDQDRALHTGNWDILKDYAINDNVNLQINSANPDDTFQIKLTYLSNK